MIGTPHERYVEDPVRMWRVLRHAGRIGFTIERETGSAIELDRDLLCACSGARLFEELNKDLSSGYLSPVFSLLRSYGLLGHILGTPGRIIENDDTAWESLQARLCQIDASVRSGRVLSSEIIMAVILWPWALTVVNEKAEKNGDLLNLLQEELMSAAMAATVPKTLKAGTVQTLYLIDRMFQAIRTGRMRWSLTKRSRYADASAVFSLLFRGDLPEEKDAFMRIFRETHPSAAGIGRRWRPQRRRRRKPTGEQKAGS